MKSYFFKIHSINKEACILVFDNNEAILLEVERSGQWSPEGLDFMYGKLRVRWTMPCDCCVREDSKLMISAKIFAKMIGVSESSLLRPPENRAGFKWDYTDEELLAVEEPINKPFKQYNTNN